MFASLLERLFLNIARQSDGLSIDVSDGGSCHGGLLDAVEHVVEELSSRLRATPHYSQALSGPVAATLRHIDEVAESIPGPVLCSRSGFTEDPRVNAMFVNPKHVQEVFSQSEEVREVFRVNPLADDCWGLLCMSMRERTQPGMALVNGEVRRDVMQTSFSLSDHQVVSPGIDESSARCALKCCMFNALLSHIRREAAAVEARNQDLLTRLQALKARQRRALQHGDPGGEAALLQDRISDLEGQLIGQEAQLGTITQHLDFVVSVLQRPADFIRAEQSFLRLNRQAVKLESGSGEGGDDFEMSKIRIASHDPRAGVLVRFPRDELLPEPDMLQQADLFLAI